MRVVVNGELKECPSEGSLAAFIEQLGLKSDRIAVELNREIAPRSRWTEILLAEGDQTADVEVFLIKHGAPRRSVIGCCWLSGLFLYKHLLNHLISLDMKQRRCILFKTFQLWNVLSDSGEISVTNPRWARRREPTRSRLHFSRRDRTHGHNRSSASVVGRAQDRRSAAARKKPRVQRR